jgi:transcriptional regulator
MLYVPDSFRESDVAVIQDFMRRYPFATVVSYRDGIHVSHLPLLLDPQRGPYGTIVGHLARANAHWRDFNGETGTTCVFHGPHAYISPTSYAARPAVPTWNYAVVHAIGTPTLIDDQQRLAAIIDETLDTFEPALRDPAADGYLPETYRAPLLKAIVGFEMPIERLDGKFKLGQNRSADDQAGIRAALQAQGVSVSELLELMRRRRDQ